MNNFKKLFVTICFSMLVPTIILVGGTNQDVWASDQISDQMRSKVGITFVEEDISGEEKNPSENTDSSKSKENSQSNNQKNERKKGMLPSTGEKQTIIISILGISICYMAIRLYKKKKIQ
ncbi:LPXTG cell wall anchor domain-containing protein [Enterococcus faecalis]|nr:LPXTG cell wall anchor domain-containing protein [Enterococcus faecalis]